MEIDEEYIDKVKSFIEQKDAENVKALLIDLHPAATCMIFQTAGSNANEVVGEINDYLEIIEKELPKDVKIAHLMSTKDWGMQVSFRLTTYL